MPLDDTRPPPAALARVTARILPNGYACWRVEIVVDNDIRSGRLPFAGFRDHAYGKRNAEALGARERRAAAAALAAYEAEHGDWRAVAAKEAADAETARTKERAISPDEAEARVDAMLAKLRGEGAGKRSRRAAAVAAP